MAPNMMLAPIRAYFPYCPLLVLIAPGWSRSGARLTVDGVYEILAPVYETRWDSGLAFQRTPISPNCT